ncbi:hypothetical protein ACJX0J_008944 [Zea mays]
MDTNNTNYYKIRKNIVVSCIKYEENLLTRIYTNDLSWMKALRLSKLGHFRMILQLFATLGAYLFFSIFFSISLELFGGLSCDHIFLPLSHSLLNFSYSSKTGPQMILDTALDVAIIDLLVIYASKGSSELAVIYASKGSSELFKVDIFGLLIVVIVQIYCIHLLLHIWHFGFAL